MGQAGGITFGVLLGAAVATPSAMMSAVSLIAAAAVFVWWPAGN
jgi:hypothetical protein